MKAARGFTLLEILVAMAIFAVVSVLAYGGLASISRQFEVTSNAQARLQEIRRGVALIERDLMQFVNRPVRDAFQGELLPPLRGGVDVDIPLELTRAGWRNPTGMPRPTLQRVAWQRIDDRLERLHWIVLDRAQDAQPVRLEVLDGVTGFELRFLDASGEWQEQWPPLDGGLMADAENARRGFDTWIAPIGIEFVLELEDAGRIRRLIELPKP